MENYLFEFNCKLTKKTKNDALAGKYKLTFWTSYLEIISLIATKYTPPLKFIPNHEKDISKIGTQYGLTIINNQKGQTDYRYIFKTALESLFAVLEYCQNNCMQEESNLLLSGMKKAIKSAPEQFSDREIIKINKIEERIVKLTNDYKGKYIFCLTILDENSPNDRESELKSKEKQPQLFPDQTISREKNNTTRKKNVSIEYLARLVSLSVVPTTASEFAIDGTGTKKFYLDAFTQKAIESNLRLYKDRDLKLRVTSDPSCQIKTVMIIN